MDRRTSPDPVARARRLLDHLAGSLVVSAGVMRLTGFVLPRVSS